METTSDGDVFLVWPTQFARHYAIEQSSDLAAWVAQPETHLGTGADARRYLFSLTPPPPGVPGPWEPSAPDTVRQHFSLSFFPTGQTLISWTQGGNSHRAVVSDDWSTVTVGDQPLPFPSLMWYADANSTPPVNFDFFTWNLQWQPLYASLVPSALPQEAQDRLALLLGNKEAIMNHAAAVISQSLSRPPDPPLPPGVNQRRFIRIVETRPDSDIDGLFDDEEMRDYLTDPLVPDSDDDGYTDLDEINVGTSPADASSLPASLPDPAAPPEIFVESRFRQVAGSVNRSGTAEEFHYDGRYVRRPANSGPWDADLQLTELLATDGVDSFLTTYPYQSFQRDTQTLQIANWYWLAETDSTPPSGGEQSGGEAHEKAHQEMLEFRLRLTKRAELPISRTYLKILREAPFTDTEGRAATRESPQPGTIPPESWPITKVEPITLSISADTSPSANSLVSEAKEIKEAVENKMAKVVSLASVEVMQPAIDSGGTVGALVPVEEVRLCRWNSPHEPSLGKLFNRQEFPKDDPARIVISISIPHKAGQGPLKVHVSTDGAANTPTGVDAAYNDPGAEVELVEKADESGLFESRSIANVADEDDDKWGEGRAADGALNDPTFIGWPGGKLKIKIPALGIFIHEISIKKFSHYFTYSYMIAGDVAGDLGSQTAINENLIRLGELYTPLHEQVKPIKETPDTITQADLLSIAGPDHDLSDAEAKALVAKIDTLGLPTDVIKIVFVCKPVIRDPNTNMPLGVLGQNQVTADGRGDIVLCFLSALGKTSNTPTDTVDWAKYRGATASHECCHSLRGTEHKETGGIFDTALPNSSALLPGWHLMSDGGINNFIQILDTDRSGKRWYLRDEEIVQHAPGNKFSKKLP